MDIKNSNEKPVKAQGWRLHTQKERGSLILYIACTPDKYELPLYVAESAAELGDMLGITKQHVYQYICRTAEKNRKGRPTQKMLRFYKVITEDGERCPTCGKLFYPQTHLQAYCSKRCWPSRGGRKEKT